MRNKNLVIGAVIGILVIIGIILAPKIFTGKKAVKKTPAVVKAAKAVKAPAPQPAKKVFAKGMGGLNVTILDSKGKPLPFKIRAFKTVSSRMSAYAASLVSNRMQDIPSGSYDLEIDANPQMIYKNVNVSEGKENVENIGHLTGGLKVKLMDSKGKEASYPVKIKDPQMAGSVIATVITNRAIEVIPGVYDLEIGTNPLQQKKGIKVTASREESVELGNVIGSLTVKAVDENGKEVRQGVRITDSQTNAVIITTTANRPVELLQGTYNIEVLSRPPQVKKDVKVSAGSNTDAEFTVEAEKPVTPPVRTKK